MVSASAKIFASRFWGFNPDTHPAVTFGLDGNRDRLLSMSGPDDLVLFVGTMNEPTLPDERSRLLGLAQFSRIPVEALEILDRTVLPDHAFNNGQYKWPKALAMLRAWRFSDPRPLLVDVLQRQLPMYATVGAVELDEIDRAAVLALSRAEIPVRQVSAVAEMSRLSQALRLNRPTTGPEATSWTGVVSRDVSGDSQTYVLRFGRSNIWKIGWAKNAKARCDEINRHVPYEHIREQWSLTLVQNWSTGDDAYRMEQRVFSLLNGFRTVNERLRCTEQDVMRAWVSALKS
ncbi:MAG: hypothetical protein J7499_17725 [Sphingopyxis sp.]|nr:hypothetical protein [Sphingopyxis sp.]